MGGYRGMSGYWNEYSICCEILDVEGNYAFLKTKQNKTKKKTLKLLKKKKKKKKKALLHGMILICCSLIFTKFPPFSKFKGEKKETNENKLIFT